MFIILCTVKQRDDNKTEQIFSATLKLVVQSGGVAGITMRANCQRGKMATGYPLYLF